jgi:hypothetical protein
LTTSTVTCKGKTSFSADSSSSPTPMKLRIIIELRVHSSLRLMKPRVATSFYTKARDLQVETRVELERLKRIHVLPWYRA